MNVELKLNVPDIELTLKSKSFLLKNSIQFSERLAFRGGLKWTRTTDLTLIRRTL